MTERDLRRGHESASSQTDLTLPIGTRAKTSALHGLPPELWTPWAKSIHERIRELNARLLSQSNSTWNKPRSAIQVMPPRPVTPNRSPDRNSRPVSPRDSRLLHPPSNYSDYSRSNSRRSCLSKSSENLLYMESDDEIMNSLEDGRLMSPNSMIGIKNHVRPVPNVTEIKMYEKTLDRLASKPNCNLSQQEVSILSMLLLAHDEEVLIRTSSVIAAAAAFSINVDPLIDSGCTIALADLLDHHSVSVQVAATQAVANLAFSERGQDLMRDCIPILVRKVAASNVQLQLDWSLMALSNFAVKDFNHELMADCVPQLMAFLSSNHPNVRLKSMKLLVNLSLNHQMVPFILGAKVT